MTTPTTNSLNPTMMLLIRVDSLVPNISSAVRMMTIKTAGRLQIAVASVPSASFTAWPVASAHWGGMWMPKLPSRLTKYPDQPTATVDAPMAYSRIRSQPMIQAKISPTVA